MTADAVHSRRQRCRLAPAKVPTRADQAVWAEVSGCGRRVAGCSWCTPCGRRGGACCCGPKTGSGPPPGAAGPCAPPARTRSPCPPPRWRPCTPARPPRSRSCSRPTPAARWRPPGSSAPHPVPRPAGHPSCGRGPCPRSPWTRRNSTTRRRSCATARRSRTCGPSSRSRTTSPAAAMCCRPWSGPLPGRAPAGGPSCRASTRPRSRRSSPRCLRSPEPSPPAPRTSPPTRPRSSRTRWTSWSTAPSAIGSPAPVSRTAVGRAPSTPG